jgi:hypothetical protein
MKVEYKVKNNTTEHHIHFSSYVCKYKFYVLSASTHNDLLLLERYSSSVRYSRSLKGKLEYAVGLWLFR